MKLRLLISSVMLLMTSTALSQIKVACVGNSITYGSTIVNRELNSYPAQLQGLLGDDYQIGNFGYPGRTALDRDEFAYMRTPEYKASLDFQPDIVLIKLGTNDSKMKHFQHIDHFKTDYQKLIDSYRALPSSPRIILLTPLVSYYPEGEAISNERIRSRIMYDIASLALGNGLEIFDSYSILGDEYNEALMPDKIHPSSIGAGILAQNIYRMLSAERDEDFDIEKELDVSDTFTTTVGYQGFECNDLNFSIVKPNIANAKHSWFLVETSKLANTTLQRKLLELGFAVVTCDKDTDKNRLAKILKKAGMNPQPAIVKSNSSKTTQDQLKEILQSEGLYENPCAKAVRGNEYRAGAGWFNGADWNQTAADITTTLSEGEVDILLLGNSITQRFAVNRKLVGSSKNSAVIADNFKGYTWESAGISGDKTQNLLWRVQNGNYNAAKPRFVTIAIGVNNATDDAQSVFEGIMAVTDAALDEFPQAKIILFGMLPTAASPERFEIFNEVIGKLTNAKLDKRVTFVDPRPTFCDAEGEPRKDLYSGDMIHLVDEGYRVWSKLIIDTIEQL